MKIKFWTRLLVLLSVLALLLGTCVLGIAAADQTDAAQSESAVTEAQSEKKNPTNEELGGFFSAKRIEYAIVVTVQGMLMIFAVLSVLWGVVAILKVFLHDLPERIAKKKQAVGAPVVQEQPALTQVPTPEEAEDEGEIVAAITAAIACVLASDEYKDEFAGGFRVVSFKRKGGAWNREQ